jgi:hypothetical protein
MLDWRSQELYAAFRQEKPETGRVAARLRAELQEKSVISSNVRHCSRSSKKPMRKALRFSEWKTDDAKSLTRRCSISSPECSSLRGYFPRGYHHYFMNY